MENKFKNKYRIKSIRLQGYDYRSEGLYFITICTKDRICFFGEIDDKGNVHLSKEGEIAHNNWLAIPEHFDNAYLGEFIIMPNHIHGIIGIDNSLHNFVESLHCNDSTNNDEYNRNRAKDEKMAAISPKAGSVSVMMRSYKSACTKEIKESYNTEFGWQSRFYDHIIRNQQSLINIENYIINNPLKWSEDENNPSNIM